MGYKTIDFPRSRRCSSVDAQQAACQPHEQVCQGDEGHHLKLTLSKTRDGQHDYLQIVSDDQFALNIVLIADKIDVDNQREPPKSKAKR